MAELVAKPVAVCQPGPFAVADSTVGVTFEQVLEELRRELSINYLRTSKASVKQTARLVGYSDPAAFSRAFKRWTGINPREYSDHPEGRVAKGE